MINIGFRNFVIRNITKIKRVQYLFQALRKNEIQRILLFQGQRVGETPAHSMICIFISNFHSPSCCSVTHNYALSEHNKVSFYSEKVRQMKRQNVSVGRPLVTQYWWLEFDSQNFTHMKVGIGNSLKRFPLTTAYEGCYTRNTWAHIMYTCNNNKFKILKIKQKSIF